MSTTLHTRLLSSVMAHWPAGSKLASLPLLRPSNIRTTSALLIGRWSSLLNLVEVQSFTTLVSHVTVQKLGVSDEVVVPTILGQELFCSFIVNIVVPNVVHLGSVFTVDSLEESVQHSFCRHWGS